MKFDAKKPPRTFRVGQSAKIEISDCGTMKLGDDEQITFVTASGKEYDVAAKSWGFYATPSVNSRLVKQGFKTALVKNSLGQYYVTIVDLSRMKEFEAYLAAEKGVVEEWLDERR